MDIHLQSALNTEEVFNLKPELFTKNNVVC